MKPRTEIINNRIVNSIEQLASFLKPGDIFRKLQGRTQYRFELLDIDEGLVVCKNMDTDRAETIYYKMPVFKLIIS
ncbi:MAG: hypothetical protein ABL895_12510 [Cyclobacteriaceae bacterium]